MARRFRCRVVLFSFPFLVVTLHKGVTDEG
jgi:hypothetical protein